MQVTVTIPVRDDQVVLDIQELATIAEGMFLEFGIKGVQDILAKHNLKLVESDEPQSIEIGEIGVDGDKLDFDQNFPNENDLS